LKQKLGERSAYFVAATFPFIGLAQDLGRNWEILPVYANQIPFATATAKAPMERSCETGH
jgi:hypothetical protein